METESSNGSTGAHGVEHSMGVLAKALAKAQAMMGNAAKDKTNPHFGNKYADLASVWEACREALTSNGFAVVQSPLSLPDSKGVTIHTLLIHESGAVLENKLFLPVVKHDPQGFGSAITYGRRYALAAMVGVAPEDDDGNAASGGGSNKAPPPPPPAGAEALKNRVVKPPAAPSTAPAANDNEPPPPTDEDAPPSMEGEDVPISASPEARGAQATHDRSVSFSFGSPKTKGQPLHLLKTEDLRWYEGALKRELADASKARFHAKTTLQLTHLQAELRFRGLS